MATIHDLAADWSNTTNPNGVWTYGYMSGVSDAFNQAIDNVVNLFGLNDWRSQSITNPGHASVEFNSSGMDITVGNTTWIAGRAAQHPGTAPHPLRSAIRFTAPANGSYRVILSWRGLDDLTVKLKEYWIYKNGVTTHTGSFSNPSTVSFDYVVSLDLGDTLDFVIGPNVDDFNNDAVETVLFIRSVERAATRKRKNSVEIKAGGTHHMTFTHSVPELVRDDFTIQLVKNGELDQSRPVEIKEIAVGVYNASFVNDSEDHAIWTLIVSDPDVEDTFYIESWRVRKLLAEQNIKQVRSRMDGDGGFFNTSGNG